MTERPSGPKRTGGPHAHCGSLLPADLHAVADIFFFFCTRFFHDAAKRHFGDEFPVFRHVKEFADSRIDDGIVMLQVCSDAELAELLGEKGYRVVSMSVVPDERPQIEDAIRGAAAADVALVLTTGGTGFSPRDVTPEATAAVCERTHACLSREAAGILGGTLVVNLPGSPKAACENISAVIGPIAHGLRILRGGPADCAAERS